MTIGADLERESVLLPKDLPPLLLRRMSVYLLVLSAAVFLFVVAVPLPEIVSARFVLKPDSGSDPVNAELQGTIENVAVRLGSSVAEGDLLFVMRSDELRKLAGEREQLRGELSAAEARLAGLLDVSSGAGLMVAALAARVESLERAQLAESSVDAQLVAQHEAALSAARQEAIRREAEVEARRRRVVSLQRMAEQAKRAHDEGVLAERDVLAQDEVLQEARAELAEAESLLSAARSSLRMMAATREVALGERQSAGARRAGELLEARAALSDAKRDLANQVESGKKRLQWLDLALVTADGDRIEIRAPYAGVVVGLAVERSGVPVARGALLCELARRVGKLQAVLQVPEAEAAKTRKGQRVRLLLDAFPYTLHGVRRAELTWVSPSASSGMLPALATLDESPEALKGAPKPLRAGMSGEARIYTGRRTLLGYVLAPLASVREGMDSEDE